MRRFYDPGFRPAWLFVLLVLVATGASCSRVRRAPADTTSVPAGKGWFSQHGEACERSPPVPGAMRADDTAPEYIAPQPRAYCVTYRSDGDARYTCTCEKAPCESKRESLLKDDGTRDISFCTELP